MGGGFVMNLNYPELYYRIYPKVINIVNSYLKDKESIEDIGKRIWKRW